MSSQTKSSWHARGGARILGTGTCADDDPVRALFHPFLFFLFEFERHLISAAAARLRLSRKRGREREGRPAKVSSFLAVLPLRPPTKAPPPASSAASALVAKTFQSWLLCLLGLLELLCAAASPACPRPASPPAFAPPSAPPYSPHPIIKCQDLPLPSLFLTFHHPFAPIQTQASIHPERLQYTRASLASSCTLAAKTARKRGSTAKPWHPPLDLSFLASTPSSPRLHILDTPRATAIPTPRFRSLISLASPHHLSSAPPPATTTSAPINPRQRPNSTLH